jgi:hypothetical protein
MKFLAWWARKKSNYIRPQQGVAPHHGTSHVGRPKKISNGRILDSL